jgi:hypothetical protein
VPPDAPAPDARALEGGSVGIFSPVDGNRETVAPDGSVQRAVQRASGSLMGAVPVPVRLGGGFLFWSMDTLYRARSFLSELEPVASIETNAIGVEFGHDFVLVLTEQEPPRAFNLERHQQVPLSPHGVTTIAAAEDQRVLALDAAGRAMSSLDGGKSWKDVGATLGTAVRGVHEDASGVAFVLDEKTGLGLERDGSFVRRPFVPASARPATELPSNVLLRNAVATGSKVSESSALLGDGNGTRVIDLRSGRISARKPAAPAGFHCQLVSPRQEGVLICFDYAMKAKTIVVSHVLSTQPQIEKTFTGTQKFEFGDDVLGIQGNCDETPLEGAACVRQSSGIWLAVNVPAELLRVWQPLTWVPRFDGSLALLAFERDVPSPRKVALIDLASGSATAWDVPLDELPQLLAPDFQRSRLQVLRDGTLRGFTSAGSLSVDPRGHVRQGRKFASLASAGEYALARDDGGRFWQTSDLGEHWQEVEPPPDSPPREAAARGPDTPPRPAGLEPDPKLQCSLLGCVIEHRSGVGAWLRLGWPEDPPRTPEAQLSAAPAAPTTLAPPAKAATARALPQLSCVARGAAQLPVKLTVQQRSSPKSSALRWVDVFAGQRKLAQRGAHPYLNVAYRDAFETESFLTFGLRGVLHLGAPGLDLQPLRERRSPLEALFVEPLDPSARVQHAHGSLGPIERNGQKATPTLPGAPAPKRRPPAKDFNPEQGSARPVLSTQPGHSAGVLLLNGEVSFWAASTGQIEPLPSDCAAENGYVDGRGMLFVSCGSPGAATRVLQADDGSTRLQLHPAAHFRIKRTLGTTYLAPGTSPFVNPDAIAVGGDGKLRVLRLPPGSDPPTADNPAWLLADDTAPLELAPWSTLQVASSAACAGGGGFRAVIQTQRPWVRLDGASARRSAMTALVRWSTERVCLEALELGYRSIPADGSQQPLTVLAVARFVGPDAGYAFVGNEASTQVRVSASCELRNSESP